jgi:hypothetical protein
MISSLDLVGSAPDGARGRAMLRRRRRLTGIRPEVTVSESMQPFSPPRRTKPISTGVLSMSLPALCFLAATEPDQAQSGGRPWTLYGASQKIQAICNGKCPPIAMQGLARPREKPPAQEQWKQWKNNTKNNANNNGNSRKCRRVPTSV